MILPDLLHDIAEYVNGRITKVNINGSYEITNFEVKAVNSNVLVLNYIIPVTEASVITLIELKDAQDNVITSNEVNVPITTDHLMLQTIELKEAT